MQFSDRLPTLHVLHVDLSPQAVAKLPAGPDAAEQQALNAWLYATALHYGDRVRHPEHEKHQTWVALLGLADGKPS